MTKSIFISELIIKQLELELLCSSDTIALSSNKRVVLAAHRRRKHLLISLACEQLYYMQSCNLASVVRVLEQGMNATAPACFLAPV